VSTAATIPAAQWRRPAARRVRAIRDRLREVYGVPIMAPHEQPLDELILTVLSQSTNDRNRDVAYERLRERFPSWGAVMAAPNEEVEEAIRPGGISKVKSKRIQEILRAIDDHPRLPPTAPDRLPSTPPDRLPSTPPDRLPSTAADGLDLSWLRDVPVPEGQAYLCSLPGVGRKTAACVLLFAFGLHDVPVDTHVSRVGMRLHLLRPGAPFEELHDAMLALTAPGEELELHVNLLRHGRRTCHARTPDCAGCALRRMCPSRRV
jgi:endonuclease-3